MEQIFEQLTSCFDIPLMISITILTYIILKLMERIVAKTHKVLKQIITSVISIILCIIFYYYVHLTLKQIIPTYLLSIAFYNSIIKKLLEYLNMGYKK